MRVSQAEMDKNHQRIVQGASRLMRKRGIEATSVNDVMKEAGLTHGGFYRHFDSKESLIGAALEYAFHEALGQIEGSYRVRGLRPGVEEYYDHYLSTGHVKHPELGCPIAALSMDVARLPESVKETFAGNFNDTVEKIAQAGNGTVEENRSAAVRKICMMAGAVMVARASNAKTGLSVLKACKE